MDKKFMYNQLLAKMNNRGSHCRIYLKFFFVMAVYLLKMFSKVFNVLPLQERHLLYRLRTNISCLRLLCTPSCQDRDPAPLFISPEVQTLLKQLTRVDLGKVFRKRRNERKLAPPQYKFLTDDQLKQAVKEAREKVDRKLQMPPVVKSSGEVDEVLSLDPELKGYCDTAFVFTDISFGVSSRDRLVVVRDPDGTLRKASREQRSRMNQLYFPVGGRQMKMPRMFEEQYLKSLLEQHEYEFVLDRACIQLEPDDSEFHRIAATAYDHVDDHCQYDALRSTRHFGPLAFHLAFHRRIDNLLLDTIQAGRLDESAALVKLFHILHPKEKSQMDAHGQHDVEVVKMYIQADAVRKSSLELALQTYLDLEEQRQSVKESIQRAHGT
ncbi:small ribosomal subunit protein mS22 [Bacillus rossius redtenbacheri]|uniref:small ribosomal subunit protein mS22 n=1 Tax=Bacillus rossius redtenbacheri TaxID=93214 RepID=UPI002FDD8A15